MKINKKILFTVLFLFTLSNTGLPVIFHVCNMMNEVTLESCGMCEAKLDEMRHSHEEHSSLKIGRDASDCCSYKTVEKSIKDNFISAVSGNMVVNAVDNIAPIVESDIDLSCSHENLFEISDGSPPGQSDNHIYLTNSILLI